MLNPPLKGVFSVDKNFFDHISRTKHWKCHILSESLEHGYMMLPFARFALFFEWPAPAASLCLALLALLVLTLCDLCVGQELSQRLSSFRKDLLEL
jgi:hypothetical protein